MKSIASSFVVGFVVLSAARAPAQDRLWTAFGDNAFDLLGKSVRVVGDVNGDGLPDVGAEPNQWYVRILDGTGGTTLYDVPDGCDISGPRDSADFDGDGTTDLLFATYCSSSWWTAWTFSGATRKEICRVPGALPISTGDVNGDGASDFVVWKSRGDLRVHSGNDGSQLLIVAPSGASVVFGAYGIASAGDWDGDGTPDLLVNDEPPPTGLGSLLIFSLADGSLLHASSAVFRVASKSRKAVSSLGDVDADGIVDYLIVNRDEDTARHRKAGVARLISGATLTEVARIEGRNAKEHLDVYGTCGDVDGDGITDFVLGPSGKSGTCVTGWLYSGATRRRLYAIQSDEVHDGPIPVSGGDLDGDGLAEMVSGHLYATDGGVVSNCGMVAADRGRRVFLTVAPSVHSRVRSPFLAGDTWFQFFAASWQPGSAASLDLVEADGAPTFVNLAVGTINGFGEWTTMLELDPGDSLEHTYGVQLTGVDRSGSAVTTAIERFGYR